MQDDETVEMGDEMMERQIFACIPIPGLNEWSKDLINSNNEVETNLYVYYYKLQYTYLISINILKY